MANRTDVAKGREIVARWCALAEARLEHLTELWETGRWRRYHSEMTFLENIREAKVAVETWRDLLKREASLDNSAIDMSWLGRARSAPASAASERLRDPAPRLQPERIEVPREPAAGVAAVTAVTEEVLLEATSPAALDAPALAPMPPLLDIAAMQKRYPLLRNAL
jgi:uncharacterized repeat protein (TIGR03809 family)